MVKIVSQNVCGLRDMKKRKEMFNYFRQKADIVCFQETHFTKNDVQIVRN